MLAGKHTADALPKSVTARRLESEAELELARKPAPGRAIAPEGTVRLPRSGARHAVAWLKLLSAVDPRKPGGFAFEGRVLKPGGEIAIAELPTPAVLLECAGTQGRSRECVYILWRYGAGAWREAARAASVGAEWAQDLAPIAERLLTARKPMGVALSAAAVADRALEVLERGMRELSREEQAEALGIVHDRLAAKVASY
ncbi:MAG TPA: hypothetical protein VNH41_10360 [Steroidobacteraceae bacterium]|nr:hypothetical protein [Steroidobacteraceae bacterium]